MLDPSFASSWCWKFKSHKKAHAHARNHRPRRIGQRSRHYLNVRLQPVTYTAKRRSHRCETHVRDLHLLHSSKNGGLKDTEKHEQLKKAEHRKVDRRGIGERSCGSATWRHAESFAGPPPKYRFRVQAAGLSRHMRCNPFSARTSHPSYRGERGADLIHSKTMPYFAPRPSRSPQLKIRVAWSWDRLKREAHYKRCFLPGGVRRSTGVEAPNKLAGRPCLGPEVSGRARRCSSSDL